MSILYVLQEIRYSVKLPTRVYPLSEKENPIHSVDPTGLPYRIFSTSSSSGPRHMPPFSGNNMCLKTSLLNPSPTPNQHDHTGPEDLGGGAATSVHDEVIQEDLSDGGSDGGHRRVQWVRWNFIKFGFFHVSALYGLYLLPSIKLYTALFGKLKGNGLGWIHNENSHWLSYIEISLYSIN